MNNIRSSFATAACLALSCLLTVSCQDNKGTQVKQETPIEFQVTGSRTIQIWRDAELMISSTAQKGGVLSLRAKDVMANTEFRDLGDGNGVLDLWPTKSQIGKHTVRIIAETTDEADTLNLQLTVVDSNALRASLVPIWTGNHWVYESAHNRLEFDTVLITQTGASGGKTKAIGTFTHSLAMLTDSILVWNDSIWSETAGLQFVLPESVPDSIDVNSTGGCYELEMSRVIEWVTDPVIVPAGTFRGCFKYTSLLEHACDNGGNDTIVEEVYIKPGIGVIKVAQIRSLGCDQGCSSRWELSGYRIAL